MFFGENIKAVRKEKKISIRELAQLTGLSKSTLNDIENNMSKNPTLETLDKIAAALGIPVIELINSPNGKTSTDAAHGSGPLDGSPDRKYKITAQGIDMELEEIYIKKSSPEYNYIKKLERLRKRLKENIERAERYSPESLETICDFMDFMLEKDEKENQD